MDYLAFMEAELDRASQVALQYFGHVAAYAKPEDSNQVVTEADIAIGEQLAEAISARFPEHNIIEEEAGVLDRHSRYTWVVDPIDGTSNFAAGLPDYGIMMGFLDGASALAGGVAVPARGRLYLAQRGMGATCNGKPIHATAESDPLETLVSYGIDSHRGAPEVTRQECAVLADLVLAVRNVRNSGSEAIDSMYVAEGRYGARISLSSKIWDNVAPQVICEEAGALWTAADGSPTEYASPVTRAGHNFTICTAPPDLHARVQRLIAGRLGACDR